MVKISHRILSERMLAVTNWKEQPTGENLTGKQWR
jgi:hypothetical protein